jgi:hypothetical protein
MVMIVKDHRKQAHGFISVTRPVWRPADLRGRCLGRVLHAGRLQLAAVEAGPWPLPRPWARNARTFALGLHPSEQ